MAPGKTPDGFGEDDGGVNAGRRTGIGKLAFRFIAGLIGCIFFWGLMTGQMPAQGWFRIIGTYVLAAVFVTYALFGDELAERLLAWFFVVPTRVREVSGIFGRC